MAYLKNIDRFGNEEANAVAVTPINVQAYKQTVQSVPNAVDTLVTGWTNQLDTSAGAWNATTGVFTATRAGYYRVAAHVCYTSGQSWPASCVVATHIMKQGARYATAFFAEKASHNQFMVPPPVTAVMNLTVGQTMSISTFQNSGGAKNTHAQSLGQFPFYLSISEII